ncbi:MAG: diguanylate cyclase [Candidatus Omnitrophica bacterium]|nr:diguanylate cyclase [Candidatus Omnitrophota bacterium]
MDQPKKILIISSDKNLREVLRFCFDGWGYQVILFETMVHDVTPIKKISPNVIVIDVHAAKHMDLEICGLLKSDFITAYIPVITLINKRQLRGHLLSIKQGVDDYLIKPPDPLDLRVRVEMAIKRLQYSFYSMPLTGLPGGRLIEENLRDRLKDGKAFSFGYLDLDNFKYFNDMYGYLQGDRVIMQTAYMLYTTILKFGNSGDFIGHIGGDDFAFITTPDKHAAICQNFIAAFNMVMPFHYNKEDRSRGYVVARARDHKIKNIPLVSVSIAVVNSGEDEKFKNVIEINEKIAEVKRYLKALTGSKYMADRRTGPKEARRSPHVFKPDTGEGYTYKPLGQILLDRKMITAEKLDEALTTHWRRGMLLGDILTQLGFTAEKDIALALKEQKSYTKGLYGAGCPA